MKAYFPFIFILMILATLDCSRIEKKITASGFTEIREVELSSRVASRVTRLLVNEGDTVKQGQLLAELDDRITLAMLDSTRAILMNAEDSFRRNQRLAQSGSISEQQFEIVKAQYLKAKADNEQARLMLEETKITAPWDGTIIKTHVETGELLAAMTSLFTLGDVNTVKVTIYVSLPQLGKIKLNMPANIMIDSFPDKVYPGRITYISDKAEFTPKNVQTKEERIKEVFKVIVTADNKDQEIKAGMPVDVDVLVSKK